MLLERAPEKKKEHTDKKQKFHKTEMEASRFSHFWGGYFLLNFCPAPASHPCKWPQMPVFFPTFCTYMREFNLHHSCRCGGFVFVGKHPELGRGGSAGRQLLPEGQRTRRKAPRPTAAAGPQLSPSPSLSGPHLAGGAEVPLASCRRHPRAKSKRAQGDLLVSSAGGQVESLA